MPSELLFSLAALVWPTLSLDKSLDPLAASLFLGFTIARGSNVAGGDSRIGYLGKTGI